MKQPPQQQPEQQHDEALLARIKTTLDEAEQSLDGATQTRLRAARRDAVAALERPRQPSWLVSAGSITAVATVAVLSIGLWTTMPEEPELLPVLEDMALLSDSAELEFYEELEFYLWLDGEQDAG